MMSAAADEVDEMCASCGIPAGDDIKLKNCTACYLVKYCSIKCQKEHRSQHKKECKKRAAELRDELLFKQPESSHLGDCPICFIPLPLPPRHKNKMNEVSYHLCCSKSICLGCVYESRLKIAEQSLEQKCPFCRTPYPEDDADAGRLMKMRLAANDPVALGAAAGRCLAEGKFSDAFKYAKQAAALGDLHAHLHLGYLYMEGKGVEADGKKGNYHLEESAIGGHPTARCNLGKGEGQWGNHERAMKHFIIAANQGSDVAVEQLREGYANGHVSKDDFAAALRAYQRAVDATKSPQREAAKRNPDLLLLREMKESAKFLSKVT